MTRVLTNPKPLATVSKVTLDEVRLVLYRNSDMTVNKFRTGITTVNNYRDSDGKVLESESEFTPLDQWPKQLKIKVNDLKDLIRHYQENQGKLPPGTDTVDIEE